MAAPPPSQDPLIFLDHLSTTPCASEVVEAMAPFWSKDFGNPSSHQHRWGWEAKAAVELARKQVAGLIDAQPREVIFTASATENINWITWNLGLRHLRGEAVHAITSRVEHSATRASFQRLQDWGVSVTWLDVDRCGRVDPSSLRAALRPTTALVSLIHGQNELGTLQDLTALAEVLAGHPCAFHLDACQTMAWQPVSVRAYSRVDLVSISSQKMYGPKGVAALFLRRRRELRWLPLLVGGDQESGLRASTVPTPLVVGMGKACQWAKEHAEAETARVQVIRDRFVAGLGSLGGVLNAPPDLPHAASVRLPFGTDETFRRLGPSVAVSTGSACGPQTGPSRVLLAVGLSQDEAACTVRWGLGRGTTWDQLEWVLQRLR